MLWRASEAGRELSRKEGNLLGFPPEESLSTLGSLLFHWGGHVQKIER